MKALLKSFINIWLSTALLSPMARAVINPSDLAPNRTYFILGPVQKPTNHFRISLATPDGPRELDISGKTLSELKTSLKHQKENGKFKPPLLTEDKEKLLLPLTDSSLAESIGSAIDEIFPRAQLVSARHLGYYGKTKILQVIPHFRRASSGTEYELIEETFDLKNNDAVETVKLIEAQTITLSVHFGPDYKIQDDFAKILFQRGSRSFPPTLSLIPFRLPVELEGTNLLGNLTARAEKKHLSLEERLALAPKHIKETFYFQERIDRLPSDLKRQVEGLLAEAKKALEVNQMGDRSQESSPLPVESPKLSISIPRGFDLKLYIPLAIQLATQNLMDVEVISLGPISLEEYSQRKISFTKIFDSEDLNTTNRIKLKITLNSTDDPETLLLTIAPTQDRHSGIPTAKFILTCDPLALNWNLGSSPPIITQIRIHSTVPIPAEARWAKVERPDKIHISGTPHTTQFTMSQLFNYTLRVGTHFESDPLLFSRPELTPSRDEQSAFGFSNHENQGPTSKTENADGAFALRPTL